VGTAPLGTQLMTYTTEGLLPREGLAEAWLDLVPGQRFFVTVRAVTGCGDMLEASSDGMTVDRTRPTFAQLAGGLQSAPYPAFQASQRQAFSTWMGADIEGGGIAKYTYRLGTHAFDGDLAEDTNVPGDVDGLHPLQLDRDLSSDAPYVFTVSALSASGLVSPPTLASAVTVDTTPPSQGTLLCDAAVRSGTAFACRWEGFRDEGSAVADYVIRLDGTTADQAGAHQLLGDTRLAAAADAYMYDHAQQQEATRHGYYYTATLVVTNRVGLSLMVVSLPIAVDDTPPTAGLVVELNTVWRRGRSHSIPADLLAADVGCQESRTQLRLAWSGFSDPESGVQEYHVAVGTSPGGEDIAAFSSVGIRTDAVVDEFRTPLAGGMQLYTSVRAVNGVGLSAVAISNGVAIRHADRRHKAMVYDGEGGDDWTEQPSALTMAAHWEIEDPCPVLQYEWAILDWLRRPVRDYRVVCARPDPTSADLANPRCAKPDLTTNAASDDGLQLLPGRAYYVAVRTTNILGETRVVRSDGVTVNPDLPLAGVVFDGLIPNINLNVQADQTTLGCSWTGFGDGDMQRRRATDMIQHYDVSFGTNPRYQATQADIVPVRQQLGMSVVVTGLTLLPRSQRYFCTVRATARNGLQAVQSSNGIRVGYGSAVFSSALVVPAYQSATGAIQVQFDGFRATVDMLYYEVAVGTRRQIAIANRADGNAFDVLNYTCICHGKYRCPHTTAPCIEAKNTGNGVLRQEELLGEEYHWNEDLFVLKADLPQPLTGDTVYYVTVRGTDNALNSITVQSGGTRLDTTPPVAGRIQVGDGSGPDEQHTAYVPDAMQVTISWAGFTDTESHITGYRVALAAGVADSCTPPAPNGLQFASLGAGARNYTFQAAQLKPRLPYFAFVTAANGVGLSVTARSAPITMDSTPPIAGQVVFGTSLGQQQHYLNQTSSLSFHWLQGFRGEGDLVCPRLAWDFSAMVLGAAGQTPTGWVSYGAGEHDYLNVRVGLAGRGISLTAQQSLVDAAVAIGGGITTSVEPTSGSKYSFDVKVGETHGAVFSAIVADRMAEEVKEFLPPGFHAYAFVKNPFSESTPYPTTTTTITTTVAPIATAANTTETIDTASTSNVTNTTAAAPTASTVTVLETTTLDPTSATATEALPWTDVSAVASFGFQIHRAAHTRTYPCSAYRASECAGMGCRVDAATNMCVDAHTILLWARHSRDESDPRWQWQDIDYDPAAAYHNYAVELVRSQLPGQADEWQLALAVDGVVLLTLFEVPTMPPSTLLLHTWAALALLPPLADPFNPWRSVSDVAAVLLESSTPFCKSKAQWNDGDSPLQFQAAIETRPGLNDVVPLQSLPGWDSSNTSRGFRLRPAMLEVDGLNPPCQSGCDALIDGLCALVDAPSSAEAFMRSYSFTNLHLKTEGLELGSTVPATYYVRLVATNGAGLAAASSSLAVGIDVTAPVFWDADRVSCTNPDAAGITDLPCGKQPVQFDPSRLDPATGEIKPIAAVFQSSDTAVMASWHAVDVESNVETYEYRVERDMGALQPRVAITNWTLYSPAIADAGYPQVVLQNLQLAHGGVYCVSVRATNGAKMTTTASAQCTTVDRTPPNVTGAYFYLENMVHELGGKVSVTAGTVLREQKLDLRLGGCADAESGITTMDLAVGTSDVPLDHPERENFLTFTPVALGAAATVTVEGATIAIAIDNSTTTFSQSLDSLSRTIMSTLVLDPGRRYFFTARCVNGASGVTYDHLYLALCPS